MFLFILFVNCQSLSTREIIVPEIITYSIHKSQLSTIFTLSNAHHIKIQSISNISFCQAQQSTMTSNFLQHEEFNDSKLLSTLLQISFNEYLIYTNDKTLIYKTNQLQQIHTFIMDINQQIQMIKIENDILIFSNIEAYLISKNSLNTQNLEFKKISDWQQRKFRKMTQYINLNNSNYILSAIGEEGLELYYINEKNITFMKQFKLFQNIIDFSIFGNNIFILDYQKGLIWCAINQNDISVVKHIDHLPNGIAIDTYNGVNLFVGYKQAKYFVVEYVINTLTGFWYKNSLIHTKQILDIDATKEFALIQGVNTHYILYNFHQEQIKTTFKHYRLRDFQIFEDQTNFYFSGITSKSYVLAQIFMEPAKVICMSQQNEIAHYELTYSKYSLGSYKTYHQQFIVKVIDTYLYDESMMICIIIGSILLILTILLVISLIKHNNNLICQQMILENTKVVKQVEPKAQSDFKEVPQIINSGLASPRDDKTLIA